MAIADTTDTEPTTSQLGGRPQRRFANQRWGVALGVVLIAELVFFSLTNRSFWGGGFGMLSQVELFLPTGIVALGLAVVVLTGNIDLSVGATASLSSVVVGRLLLAEIGILPAVLLALLVGALIGLINGLLVARLKLDSLLVTLAMQFVVASVAQAVAGTRPPQDFPEHFRALGRGSIAQVPTALLLFLGLGILVAVYIDRTRAGRATVLTGHNPSAARYTGLPVDRTLVSVFVICGAIAALGGVLLAAYYNAGRPASGMSLLMPALTCVVLGGVDVFGGKGRIPDVIVAVLLLGFLTQGLLNSGFSSLTTTMITGLLLVLALLIKGLTEGRSVADQWQRLAARLRGSRPVGPGGADA